MNKTTYLPCLHVRKISFQFEKILIIFCFSKTIQAKVNLEVQLVMSKGLGGVINQAHLIHDQSKGRSSTRLHQPPGGRSSMGTGFSWVGRTPCTRTFLHSLQPDRACAARVQA